MGTNGKYLLSQFFLQITLECYNFLARKSNLTSFSARDKSFLISRRIVDNHCHRHLFSEIDIFKTNLIPRPVFADNDDDVAENLEYIRVTMFDMLEYLGQLNELQVSLMLDFTSATLFDFISATCMIYE